MRMLLELTCSQQTAKTYAPQHYSYSSRTHRGQDEAAPPGKIKTTQYIVPNPTSLLPAGLRRCASTIFSHYGDQGLPAVPCWATRMGRILSGMCQGR
jgi:hypothetical protein